MTFRKLTLAGATLLLAAPMFASTYFGGFEDVKQGDYDYNDVVFSLSGNGLTLHTNDGAFYNKPVLGTTGNPFWNNASFDGPKYNVGYCIYGGGNCGAGLAPNSQYLAASSSPSKTPNFVYFTANGTVSTVIDYKISAQNDVLGWYDSTGYHLLDPTGASGTFAFNPTGNFGLFGSNYLGVDCNNSAQYGPVYYSINTDPNEQSHFAFFTPTPEPGTMGAMAGGLILIGAIYRRRRFAAQQ